MHKSQRVLDHQRFQFTVVRSTPERPFQESPANLYFTLVAIQVPIARTSNDSTRSAINYRKGALGLNRSGEEPLKDFGFVAIIFWMLFPDERITGCGKKSVKVAKGERAYLNQVAD